MAGMNISRPIPLLHLVRGRYGTGRIFLPVERDQSLYARFKYVRGFPSFRDGEGFSLSKLELLDNLIERLGRITGKKAFSSDMSSLTSAEVDQLSETFKQKLHQEITRPRSIYSGNTLSLETGVILDMVA